MRCRNTEKPYLLMCIIAQSN